jgi:hypothetical protein
MSERSIGLPKTNRRSNKLYIMTGPLNKSSTFPSIEAFIINSPTSNLLERRTV